MPYTPKGYTYNPTGYPQKPYQAQMSVDKKTVLIGYFSTAAEATAAYVKARAERPRIPNYKPKEVIK